MNTDEVISTLKGNVGKSVSVIYTSGGTDLLSGHSVDEEGFLTDPISPGDQTYPPDKCGWWARFEWIDEVRAVAPQIPGDEYL